MKALLSAPGLFLLAGFSLFSTGCVTEYESSASYSSYSGTTLPAAGTVALVLEFRGGEPTPEERIEVRALLADYFSQQGTVLVDGPDAADYLVHAVMERRNPANSSEWTLVETYSANSLRSAGSDEFRWPGGIIEDEYYQPTTFSYIGFGVFYPVFFESWSNPWHRGPVVLCPPPRRHDNWSNDRWRDERRWHRPARWQRDRHPEWNRPGQTDRKRDDNRGRDKDRRENDRRPTEDRRPRPDRDRVRSSDTPRSDAPVGIQGAERKPTQPSTVRRPPGGGDHRPEPVQPPRPGNPRRDANMNRPPHVAPPPSPPPQPATSAPEVRREQRRPGLNTGPGRGPEVSRPPAPHFEPNQPPPHQPPPQRVQPADRRAGRPDRIQPGNPEHRRSPTPTDNPPQVRRERRDPPQAERPREEHRQRTVERKAPPAPERKDPAPDRRRPPKDQDKDDSDKDRPRH